LPPFRAVNRNRAAGASARRRRLLAKETRPDGKAAPRRDRRRFVDLQLAPAEPRSASRRSSSSSSTAAPTCWAASGQVRVPEATTDWHDVLKEDLDIVVVGLPGYHYEQAKAALEARPRVCEKPFTSSASVGPPAR
jgi:predicted dehydrogenase